MKKRQGKKPDCTKCDKPILLPENYFVYSLIAKYSELFVNDMGGVSAEGIRLCLDIEKIHYDDRPLLTQKIIVYISAALLAQQESKNQ